MTKCRKTTPAPFQPIRIKPDENELRFYRMDVWPDLFGRALLVRQWGPN
jgi:hypothetical protein